MKESMCSQTTVFPIFFKKSDWMFGLLSRRRCKKRLCRFKEGRPKWKTNEKTTGCPYLPSHFVTPCINLCCLIWAHGYVMFNDSIALWSSFWTQWWLCYRIVLHTLLLVSEGARAFMMTISSFSPKLTVGGYPSLTATCTFPKRL